MIKEKKHTGTVITSGTTPFPWRKFLGLFFLSAILIVSFWPVWQSLLLFSQPSFLLRMAVKTAEPQTAQLFYNTGSGFSQENSVTSNLPGDGRFHDHFFPIPAQSIQGFRFDPAVSKDALVIKRADIVMEITRNVHIAVKHIDLQNLMSVNQIKELAFKSGELTVLTEENANDPQIVIPVSFHSWSQSWIFWHLAKMILKILTVGLLCGLLLWIWCRWDDQTSGIIAVIALIVFGLRCGSTYVSATSPMLNISVQSSTYGEMALYYDLGQGLSENNSTRTIVYPDKIERHLSNGDSRKTDPEPANRSADLQGYVCLRKYFHHRRTGSSRQTVSCRSQERLSKRGYFLLSSHGIDAFSADKRRCS